jgi:hypothetical protein
LLRGWPLSLLGFFGALTIPPPDRPVVWAAVFLAFEIKAGDSLEDFQPGARVAANLDLRCDWPKRIEGLIEQVAHDASLWLIAGCPNVTDRQIVVHAHVALDETRDIPVLGRAIVALQDEDVTACRGARVAFATSLMVGVGEG